MIFEIHKKAKKFFDIDVEEGTIWCGNFTYDTDNYALFMIQAFELLEHVVKKEDDNRLLLNLKVPIGLIEYRKMTVYQVLSQGLGELNLESNKVPDHWQDVINCEIDDGYIKK